MPRFAVGSTPPAVDMAKEVEKYLSNLFNATGENKGDSKQEEQDAWKRKIAAPVPPAQVNFVEKKPAKQLSLMYNVCSYYVIVS